MDEQIQQLQKNEVNGAATGEAEPRMEVVELMLDQIEQDRDPRGECDVDDLVDSIREVGLIHPVMVRRRDDGKYSLLSGNRRFRAYKALGREKIQAFIRTIASENEELRAEIAAIHENLRREDLPLSAKAREMSRLKEAFERLHPELKHGGSRSKPGSRIASRHGGDLVPERFSKQAAKATGMSERSVQRLALIGEKATAPVLKALDAKQIQTTEAEALAAQPKEAQEHKLSELLESKHDGAQVSQRQGACLGEPGDKPNDRDRDVVIREAGDLMGKVEEMLRPYAGATIEPDLMKYLQTKNKEVSVALGGLKARSNRTARSSAPVSGVLG